MDLGVLRYHLLRWWARRWEWPGMWLLGEALDRIESRACRHLGTHTRRCRHIA